MQKLVKKLEAQPHWHIQTVYLDKKFVEEVFIDFLRIIGRDSRLKQGKVKNPNSLISKAIRALIASYTKKMKADMLQKSRERSRENINNNRENINNNETSNNSNQ